MKNFLIIRGANGDNNSLQIADKLKHQLSNIHDFLNEKEEPSEKPDWADLTEFELAKAKNLLDTITANIIDINRLSNENDGLLVRVKEIEILKNLLFETGKPLEMAVIQALLLLGYSAENFDDGILEIDQVILSPEGIRFIGECEGKESKPIDISKFRQLQDTLNEDFQRDGVDEKAFGILFGNPQRLVNPLERTLDFTDKCKKGAQREKVALVLTVDLYYVSRYLSETNDDKYRKECRDAIYAQLGNQVSFPKVPNM